MSKKKEKREKAIREFHKLFEEPEFKLSAEMLARQRGAIMPSSRPAARFGQPLPPEPAFKPRRRRVHIPLGSPWLVICSGGTSI